MVKYGLFGLGLVRAETGDLYQEHAHAGGDDIYAEVEPDDEFYLELRSDAPGVVYADIRVDGELIQKGHRLRHGTASKVGVVRAGSAGNEGANTEVALRFARARVHDGSREAAADYWTGQVEVTFHGDPIHRIPPGSSPSPYSPVKPATSSPSSHSRDETADASSSPSPCSWDETADSTSVPATQAPIPSVIFAAPVPVTQPRTMTVTYAAPKNTYYVNPSLASSDVGYVPGKSAESQKKGVKSAEGRTALRTLNLNWSKKPDKPKEKKKISRKEEGPVVKEPEVLGTLTLRYCSTVGLIHAGILAKPPNWGVELLRKACSKRTLKENARILSKIKVRKIELVHETVNGDGKVVNKREVEVLDITEGGDEW